MKTQIVKVYEKITKVNKHKFHMPELSARADLWSISGVCIQATPCKTGQLLYEEINVRDASSFSVIYLKQAEVFGSVGFIRDFRCVLAAFTLNQTDPWNKTYI